VIFIGEAHTSKRDHAVQMEVIRHIKESGRKVAIALEMFPNTLQAALNAWIGGRIDEAEFRDAYYLTWTVPYSQYSKIFRYARENRVPLIGINVDPSYINYIKTQGIERVSKETLRSIKYSSCMEETGYTEEMSSLLGSLSHKQGFMATCDILRFREAFMAYNLSRNIVGNDYTVVVILGAIHALDFAVPEMLGRHSGESYKVVLPEQLYRRMGKSSVK